MSEEHLNNLLDQISDFENKFIESSERIMRAGHNKLFTLDLVALSINNRAISLIKGYLTFVKADNYLTSVLLVRLQLDNALRFLASSLVENSSDFAENIIDGKARKTTFLELNTFTKRLVDISILATDISSRQ